MTETRKEKKKMKKKEEKEGRKKRKKEEKKEGRKKERKDRPTHWRMHAHMHTRTDAKAGRWSLSDPKDHMLKESLLNKVYLVIYIIHNKQ